jgi:hypothetical protein
MNPGGTAYQLGLRPYKSQIPLMPFTKRGIGGFEMVGLYPILFPQETRGECKTALQQGLDGGTG